MKECQKNGLFWAIDVLFLVILAFVALGLSKTEVQMWVAGLCLNNFVGALVFSFLDDGRLSKWADEAPSLVFEALITQMWPLLVFFWVKNKLSEEK